MAFQICMLQHIVLCWVHPMNMFITSCIVKTAEGCPLLQDGHQCMICWSHFMVYSVIGEVGYASVLMLNALLPECWCGRAGLLFCFWWL